MRGDARAVGVALLPLGQQHADDRFAVGAHMLAQRGRQPRQRARPVAAVKQQLQGTHHAGRHDDLARPEGRRGRPAEAGPRRHNITTVGLRHDAGHRGLSEHLRAALRGEVQVVQIEAVLGAVAARGQALAAMLAAVALRPGAVEIGVDALAALPEVDRLRLDAGEGVPRAQGFGGALQQMVLQAARRVGARAQHALGLGVVRRQRLLPARLRLRPGGR